MKGKAGYIVLYFIFILLIIVGGIKGTVMLIDKIMQKEQQKEVITEKQEVENLVINIPEQNKQAMVVIITKDPKTGEEIQTNVYGTIETINDGKNGKEQQYILYTEQE